MPTPSIAVLIVAAGRGTRAGGAGLEPKQYRMLAGRTVLRRTIDAFDQTGIASDIVVVRHRDDGALYDDALRGRASVVRSAIGGATRQESVRLGLEALAGSRPDIVLIHDAARPFVDSATVERVVAAVRSGFGALPVLPVSDTLKRVAADNRVVETVPRTALCGAQTPQGFPFDAILAAHRAAAAQTDREFTDDASIAEWHGLPVRVVEGSSENVKLTTADDMVRAEARLKETRGMIDVRTGNGYDVHRLVDGNGVALCGVAIPHDQALSGHSDADVGLHALTDALLATCGAGDIGDHFPPSDETWRGAASHIFVRRAVEIVASKGGRIMNADVTLICEAPKIAPHREAMRRAIADMTGLDLVRVSVKATTNETIGFVGRREGIAAIATASVAFGEPR